MISVFEAARRFPDRPAVLDLDYRALAARVEHARRRLPNQPAVQIVGGSDLESVIQILAVLESDATAVLIHPRWTASERARLPPCTAGDAAAVFYTSGSSGTPKGVRISRSALEASALATTAALAVTADDRWLLNLPTAHVAGFSALTRCICVGASLVVEDPTIASFVPTQVRRGLHRGFRNLRRMLVGGAPAARLHDPRILESYGLTEASSTVAIAGVPIPGTEVRISDFGHVLVRGPTLFSGYVGGVDHEGWFDTQDLGEVRGGRLVVLGRADDMIVSGGENVHPAEVESVLMSHPSIESACVVGVPDEDLGERVTALIVPSSEPVNESELDAFVRDRLAGHKRPRRVCWVDELVVTAGGKLDRRATRARLV